MVLYPAQDENYFNTLAAKLTALSNGSMTYTNFTTGNTDNTGINYLGTARSFGDLLAEMTSYNNALTAALSNPADIKTMENLMANQNILTDTKNVVAAFDVIYDLAQNTDVLNGGSATTARVSLRTSVGGYNGLYIEQLTRIAQSVQSSVDAITLTIGSYHIREMEEVAVRNRVGELPLNSQLKANIVNIVSKGTINSTIISKRDVSKYNILELSRVMTVTFAVVQLGYVVLTPLQKKHNS